MMTDEKYFFGTDVTLPRKEIESNIINFKLQSDLY